MPKTLDEIHSEEAAKARQMFKQMGIEQPIEAPTRFTDEAIPAGELKLLKTKFEQIKLEEIESEKDEEKKKLLKEEFERY